MELVSKVEPVPLSSMLARVEASRTLCYHEHLMHKVRGAPFATVSKGPAKLEDYRRKEDEGRAAYDTPPNAFSIPTTGALL